MPQPADPGAVLRFVLGTNNVFAVRDACGALLVDAGPDYAGAWEDLCAQLHAHGLAPNAIHTVVLTHAHQDHAGLAARWQAAGARIYAGRADAPALALDPAARELERARGRAELLRQGAPLDALTAPTGAGERYTRWPAPLRMTAVRPDILLDHGTTAGTHGRALRVVAAPGHTPGTLLLLDGTGGAVFSGDHLLPRMAPTSGIQFTQGRRHPSLPAYLASLRAVRDLPAARVYPGHGEPFADLGEAVDWTIRFLEQRARRTLVALRRGPGTTYELALRLFPHLTPRHLRPVLAETLGLLDLLAERGLAIASDTGEPVRWHATTVRVQD